MIRSTADDYRAEGVDRLARLQALTAALSGAATSGEVADAILSHGLNALDACVGIVALLNVERTEFITLRLIGYEDDVADTWSRFPVDTPVPLADAVRQRELITVETAAERQAQYPELTRIRTVVPEGALVALPLLVQGTAIGGFALRFRTYRTFTRQDRDFMLTLAGLCAQALARADLFDAERAARRQAEQEIARRQRLEEELRQSQEQLRSAFDRAAIGKALVAPDGHFLQVNRSLCTLVGYTEQELLARTFQDITHPDDLDADLAHSRDLLAGTIATYQMEKRYFHKAGHVVWILLSASLVRDVEGEPHYFIAQIQDITARKRAEEERESLIRQLQEALGTVKTLTGLLPICAWCQKVRNDAGYWKRLETYLADHLDVSVTHCMCPACLEKNSALLGVRQ